MTIEEREERARKLYEADTELLGYFFAGDSWDTASEEVKRLYRLDVGVG